MKDQDEQEWWESLATSLGLRPESLKAKAERITNEICPDTATRLGVTLQELREQTLLTEMIVDEILEAD